MDEQQQRDCQTIVRTLQRSLRVATASGTIRELFAVPDSDERRCGLHLSSIKRALADIVGEDGILRIASFDEEFKDVRRAQQALMHVHDDVLSALSMARTWAGWFRWPG